ncbi:hypothetical protein [Streptomyces thermoalcalitolerans]|uniref:Uncharacterized protein n=1 Tax=Streptomyces thermoalcalitolerans TaxID=65605 RepID=A0ABN1NHI5_9ACTN
MVPINIRAPVAVVRAWAALEWSVVPGHRYRPRQGCTGGNSACAVLGVHPLPQSRTPAADAVLVPRPVGSAAMAGHGSRQVPQPCHVAAPDARALFVLPMTDRCALVDEAAEARTGPDGWGALPPGQGTRGDTPPRDEEADETRNLTPGEKNRHALDGCLAALAGVSDQ